MNKNMYQEVQSRYGDIAKRSGDTGSQHDSEEHIAKAFGYSTEDLCSPPDKANLGLSCGNPVAYANMKEGETVVDLGSGGGIDVFLAIGIDMTKDMIELADNNANSADLPNTLFIEASITSIPLLDSTVDCIISNCVINLVPRNDKPSVFKEIARLLKSGVRVAISDILARKPLPQRVTDNLALYEYMTSAGFKDVLMVDTKSDLNLYKQSSYLAQGGCCGPTDSSKDQNGLIMIFTIYTGSFQIYAIKTESIV
ncbi:arsenite methyltransferase [Dipodascopsis uninucleata]